ncbi:MAG: hypothetical protein IJH86_11645 [Clostridia bacterium]|nr:hypothetical protein [Clostridia bacterium]
MKIYDFDAKFFDYVRTWMALHPGLKEDEVEQKYNEMMLSWLNAPAQWLNGEKPGEYFNRYTEPRDLMKLLEEYMKRDIGLPEPLYSRIVALGDACAPYLVRIVQGEHNSEKLRGTALALLGDMENALPRELCIDLICASEDGDDLGDLAAEALMLTDDSVVEQLMDRYDGATEYGKMTILDVCSKYRVHERAYAEMVKGLMTEYKIRGYYAGLLADYGDPRAVEPLMQALQLTDLNYLDYIEVRNAIEALGGDPGEERVFDGDPDYEALRNM